MANKELEIQTLFATPLARLDISEALDSAQVAYIMNLPMIRNQQNMISEDLYIFKHPELKKLATAVQTALTGYAKYVMGIEQDIVITQSWALLNQPGVGMHAHAHSNSIVSGSVYYAPLPEPVSRVVFDKHTHYQQIEMRPAPGHENIYNTPRNVITPRQGEVIMFPSDLNHMIESNGSQAERRAIAFNSFVKGTIGDYRDVSELHV